MSRKILFVDDDANLLASMERTLRRKFEFETAVGGEAGLEKIAAAGPFAVVVSDRQMPVMDGLKFLSTVRERSPETVRIMLTGNVDLEQAVRVVNEGNIFRFLIKPCPPEVLCATLTDALAQHHLITAEKELLSQTLDGSIKLLTDMLTLMDARFFGHGDKLRSLLDDLGKKNALPGAWEIQLAAMLSPIGLVTLPPETIVKARAGQPLSKNEEQLIGNVPEITARLLAHIPRLGGVANIARYQNKCFNGDGLPESSVKGEAIPYGARLLKILNDLLQLQAQGAAAEPALEELSLRQGLYDPQLLALVKTSLSASENQDEAKFKIVPLKVSELAFGMTLASDIFTKEDTLVLATGHLINDMILEKIENFNLMYGIKEPVFVRIPVTGNEAVAQ